MQKQNNSQRNKNSIRVARFYVILIIISVIVMIIAAYITYGYDGYVGHISFKSEKTNQKNNKDNTKNSENKLTLGANLSMVPNDKMIEDILNNAIPNVCKYDDATDKIKKKCKKKPLSCLKSYNINKILVKNSKYQNQLFIELLTGKKVQKKYTVVIDLSNNNQVLNEGGEIDKKRCRKLENGKSESHLENDDSSIMKEGDDPLSSQYVKTKENTQ